MREGMEEGRAALARYYNRGMQPSAPGLAVAEPRRDMHPKLADLLGLDPHRAVTAEELGHIFAGQRADGQDIAGRQKQKATVSLADALGLDPSRAPTEDEVRNVLAGQRADGAAVQGPGTSTARQRFLTAMGVSGNGPDPGQERNLIAGKMADGSAIDLEAYKRAVERSKPRIAAVDLTFSAGREVSIAWALAPTEAERAIIHTAHRDAVAATMKVIAADLGHARKGKGGKGGTEPAHMGWFTFDHFAARPVVDIARVDDQGVPFTSRHEVGSVGDMSVHSHVLVPSVLLTDSGRVVALDLDQLGGRVLYYGAVYQANLSSALQAAGADASLDMDTGAATFRSVPKPVTKGFSKRTEDGTDSARAFAASKGLDWDTMTGEQRAGLVHSSTQARRRSKSQSTSAPENRAADFGAWQAQARGMGYRHETVLGHQAPRLSEDERREAAFKVFLILAERELQNSAVLDAMKVRELAARSLVATGTENAVADVDWITRTARERGVRQDGQTTALVWGEMPAVRGKARMGVTTELHESRERETVRLIRQAAADRSGALGRGAVTRALERREAMPVEDGGLRFTGIHGEAQRDATYALGCEGRVAAFFGAAGAGKSSILSVLNDAWERDGRTVYGASLGWHQTDSLAEAGIRADRRAAFDPFLAMAHDGQITLNRRSVLVIEEAGRIGSQQLHDVMKLQAQTGASVVFIAGPGQLQAIQAGDAIDALRRGLGTVPEINTTLRQRDDTEKETTAMFRGGRAAEAIRRKAENGTVELVPGDRQAVLARVAALWRDRVEAGAEVTASAPTNADARDVALAIREQRRSMGQVGEDLVQIDATSRRKHNPATGDDYTMPLAIGDRVRLYERAAASFVGGGHGNIGNNGSVLEVRAIGAEGLILRNAKGTEGLLKWETLRDQGTGRIRLGWGDALTIDAALGSTVGRHILAAPSGSKSVDGYKGYTAGSRHRDETLFVFSEAAERREVTQRRPRGDYRPITPADLWENVSRNLARQPERATALAFLERAENVRRGTVRNFQATVQPFQQATRNGQPSAPRKHAAHTARAQAQAGAQAPRQQARAKCPASGTEGRHGAAQRDHARESGGSTALDGASGGIPRAPGPRRHSPGGATGEDDAATATGDDARRSGSGAAQHPPLGGYRSRAVRTSLRASQGSARAVPAGPRRTGPGTGRSEAEERAEARPGARARRDQGRAGESRCRAAGRTDGSAATGCPAAAPVGEGVGPWQGFLLMPSSA
jgi:hypothetical protein